MEIFWFVIGILVGILIAWWFLSKRCDKQLEEREAELGRARLKIEQDLEQERRAHETTRERLSEAKERQSSVEQHAKSLEGDVTTIRNELDNLSSLSAAAKSEHHRLESDMQQLDSQLNESNREKTQLAERLEEARISRDRMVDADRSRISDFERRIGEQESEIVRLQAELDAAQSGADNTTPDAAPYTEKDNTAPAYGVTGEPPSSLADDLTKIKGIGRVLQGKLHQLDITTFRQIADFTQSDIERVDAVLDFPGRIERERWVEQARAIVGDTRSI